MTSPWSLGLACGLVLMMTSTAWAYDSALYEDMLFQDLYKRLAQMDDLYYPLEDEQQSQAAFAPLYDHIVPDLDARDSGQADIRDPEFLSQSANSDGFQYISGGAGEGKQHLTPEGTQENIQEVKSDDVLPFYCHPPNPCPKGFTEEDGCQLSVQDSAEIQKQWISEMENKGMCTCDEEHMFDCGIEQGAPTGMDEMGASENQVDEDDANALMRDMELEQSGNEAMSNFINSIMGDKDNYQNPYAKGNRIAGLVAKKAPRVKRSGETSDETSEHELQKRPANPYMQGQKVHVVAKKGGRDVL